MGLNFLEVQDNLLTKKECADVIEWVRSNRNILEDENYEKSGYIFCDLYLNILHRFDGIEPTDSFAVYSKTLNEAFAPVPLRTLRHAIIDIKDE